MALRSAEPTFVACDGTCGIDEELEDGRGVVPFRHYLQFQSGQVVGNGDRRGSYRDLAGRAGHDEGEAAPVTEIKVAQAVDGALPGLEGLPRSLQSGHHEVVAGRDETSGSVAEPLAGEVPQSGLPAAGQGVALADDRDQTLTPQRLTSVLGALRHVKERGHRRRPEARRQARGPAVADVDRHAGVALARCRNELRQVVGQDLDRVCEFRRRLR